MHTREEKMRAFGRMLDVLDTLREKCPWDKKQTNDSLRPNTIEETYELCDAIMENDQQNICKELGDVLLHVCFYSKIGEENKSFDIAEVCDTLTDKLIFRHPHVYHPSQVGVQSPKPLPYGIQNGEETPETISTSSQVSEKWEQIKQREKGGNKTVLSGVPKSLPSIIKAYRIQEKAHNVGFDWQDKREVWAKVKEELSEFETELLNGNTESAQSELGDFIFSIINAARLYELNPDNALEHTNQKFIRRFNYIEEHAKKEGLRLTDMSISEMDKLWNEAKKDEHEERR